MLVTTALGAAGTRRIIREMEKVTSEQAKILLRSLSVVLLSLLIGIRV